MNPFQAAIQRLGLTVNTILFDGQDLLVRAVTTGRKDRLVVTFDFWRCRPDTRRHGFLEGFFKRIDVDAVHIVSKENHWFQTPELLQVIDAVAELTSSYQHVIGFGSSMGGFAAMHYGAHFGAEIVLALSPLYSVDGTSPPFEKRWLHDQNAIIRDRKLPASTSRFPDSAIVFYDPHNDDARHVELYRTKTFLKEVRMPFSDHPCTHTLIDTGMLQSIFVDILNGRFDGERTLKDWRSLRGQSGEYLNALARRVRSSRLQKRLRQRAAAFPGWLPPRLGEVPRDWWRWPWNRLRRR